MRCAFADLWLPEPAPASVRWARWYETSQVRRNRSPVRRRRSTRDTHGDDARVIAFIGKKERGIVTMNHLARNTALASAVATLFACGASAPQPTAPSGTASNSSVKCQGINSCKGQAECAGNGHPCGKHTACKGQGWLTVPSAGECVARGGKPL
jgi:uncharacterized membrane protein